jgi:pimeloyl-ACP methyl ester carboxylesterase
MASASGSERSTARFDIDAIDGVPLAVWVEGAGPALVLVHGSIADHTTFDPFVEVLRDDFTTYALDRRGFGASGDGERYAIERDFEDAAAVVDTVAARTGGPVALWGHSYGANVAMGAATLTPHVHHLVVYEPSFGLQYPPGVIDQIEASLAEGDPEAAIVAVLAKILELTDEEIDAMRDGPLWSTRLAVAHTVPRECRVEEEWVIESGQFDAIAAPTLFLSGRDSVPEIKKATDALAAVVPHARIEVLDGHAHFAHKTDPRMVSTLIQSFLSI